MEELRIRVSLLKKDVSALYLALKDRRTPLISKVFAFLTVIYFLSPIDIIPDFIPLLGYLDDLIILPILIALTVRTIPADLMDSFRKESEGMWKDGRPEKWYYAIPIVVIYILLIYWFLKTFTGII